MKIGNYFTTYSITAGFLIASLGSSFIYLEWFSLSNALLETILSLLFFWFLLQSNKKIWFWSGFFISILWFWWIMVSFKIYHMLWAIPIGMIFISTVYGFIFYLIVKLSDFISLFLHKTYNPISKQLIESISKVIALVMLSHIHPLGFDWFKPELVFVHTFIGVNKWQLAIVLSSIILSQYKKNILYLLPILLAYSQNNTYVSYEHRLNHISLAGTMTTIEDKWDKKLIGKHIQKAFSLIDKAIKNKDQMVILPESVFPFFLNKERDVLDNLLEKSKHITIVIGALYLDGKTHRNSTYIIQNEKYIIANKVVLVPFGESNPLPSWASKWVNKVFFDNAIDYIASKNSTDFEIGDTVYRNAICYESTSELLYTDNPKAMIVTSNNGWFIPSIEPTLQRLLLEFYNRKYGTTIYHSINMSPSYTIKSKENR